MVRQILWYLFIAIIVILILAWLFTGGIGKIKSAALSFGNPLANPEGGVSFLLPWQTPIPQGPTITGSTEESAGQNSDQSDEQSASQTNSQAATFGNPSPYENELTISADGASASDPGSQYVTIQNESGSPIDVTGWSVQSALSGARAYIPRGASFFEIGALNAQTDIEIAPGGSAIITSGVSPVGTSFRENECSGYLEQLQNYTPPIESSCPSPSDAESQAAQFGQSCADFVSSLPSCTFTQDFSGDNLSSACQAYVQTNFSYNGCVQTYQNDSSFASNDWRIYLGASRVLWNSTDTIRLLDAQGQVVAVTSY